MELFNEAGFEIEEFGGNSVKISAVPSEITGIAIRNDTTKQRVFVWQKGE